MGFTERLIDTLAMPQSAVDALAKAMPDQLCRDLVSDDFPRAAPTPPAPKSNVDQLVERFKPKA